MNRLVIEIEQDTLDDNYVLFRPFPLFSFGGAGGNPIYRAKINAHVTRSIRCVDL